MPPKSKSKTAQGPSGLDTLKAQLREGQPGRLYLFHGEEVYLRDHYVNQLKALLLPQGLEDFNLHTAQGKDCSVEWIQQAVDCLPMMSQRTLVLVTDFDLYGQGEKGREALAQLFSDLPDYCCLVFVYDLLAYKADGRSKLAAALKAHGLTVDFRRQEQSDLLNWIARHFKATGHTIAGEDARYLTFLCGELMTNLASEIDKIAAYAQGERVTRADIDAVAVPLVDAIVFQMTDAIARKNFNKAAAVLADLLHSQESPIMILSVMGKYFRQLYTARLYLDRGKSRQDFMALWNLKNPYPADKLLDAARGFSLAWCRHAVLRCSQTDLQLKANYGQERETLTGLLMELAAGRRAIPC